MSARTAAPNRCMTHMDLAYPPTVVAKPDPAMYQQNHYRPLKLLKTESSQTDGSDQDVGMLSTDGACYAGTT